MGGFCENCKVHIEKDASHCPLCGTFIEEVKLDDKELRYPKYKRVRESSDSATDILIKLGLLAIIICVGLDLFINGTMGFSLYVLVCTFYGILTVLLPIKKKYNLAQIMNCVAYYTMGLLLFLELFTGTWGWGVCIAIPAIWLAIDIVAGICMLAFGYVNFEMFKPILSIAILSTISLIFLLCFHQPAYMTLPTMFFSWTEIALMFMFRFKRSIRSLKKDFRL